MNVKFKQETKKQVARLVRLAEIRGLGGTDEIGDTLPLEPSETPAEGWLALHEFELVVNQFGYPTPEQFEAVWEKLNTQTSCSTCQQVAQLWSGYRERLISAPLQSPPITIDVGRSQEERAFATALMALEQTPTLPLPDSFKQELLALREGNDPSVRIQNWWNETIRWLEAESDLNQLQMWLTNRQTPTKEEFGAFVSHVQRLNLKRTPRFKRMLTIKLVTFKTFLQSEGQDDLIYVLNRLSRTGLLRLTPSFDDDLPKEDSSPLPPSTQSTEITSEEAESSSAPSSALSEVNLLSEGQNVIELPAPQKHEEVRDDNVPASDSILVQLELVATHIASGTEPSIKRAVDLLQGLKMSIPADKELLISAWHLLQTPPHQGIVPYLSEPNKGTVSITELEHIYRLVHQIMKQDTVNEAVSAELRKTLFYDEQIGPLIVPNLLYERVVERVEGKRQKAIDSPPPSTAIEFEAKPAETIVPSSKPDTADDKVAR